MKCDRMLLMLQPIKGSHTGTIIAEELDQMLDTDNLRSKVQYTITDNASNMKKAFEVLNAVEDMEAEVVLDGEQL